MGAPDDLVRMLATVAAERELPCGCSAVRYGRGVLSTRTGVFAPETGEAVVPCDLHGDLLGRVREAYAGKPEPGLESLFEALAEVTELAT